MKNYIILYRTFCGITGEVIEKCSLGWASNEDNMWEYACDTFGSHCIIGMAEVVETV